MEGWPTASNGVDFRLREPFAFFPLAAYRVVPARAFASMRAFLSTLASASPGTSAARGPKSMDEFLANFRGATAGGWRPLLAAWKLRKDIHITQRPAGGRIEEIGNHRELIERNGRYAQLFRLQARGYLS